MKARIRKNDLVFVTSGKDRGKSGRVLRVLPESDRAVVEGVNLVKRHMRARSPQGTQGIVEREASVHISNLRMRCAKCDKLVRMSKKIGSDGNAMRACRSCGTTLDG